MKSSIEPHCWILAGGQLFKFNPIFASSFSKSWKFDLLGRVFSNDTTMPPFALFVFHLEAVPRMGMSSSHSARYFF